MLTYPLGDGAELRPLEPWQAGDFAEFIERNRPHLAAWLPWATTITDAAIARGFLQDYADRQAADRGRIYGLWLNGVLAGGTLFRVFDPRSGTCEVGVWLGADAEGRGLITRAVRGMIDWAIHERGMRRVEWRTVPANARSLAVAKRLGMTQEGVLRQAFELNGTRHDIEIWALLADDWPRRSGDQPR
jgi:ribosomal-protein-serine acetyltransferase